MIIKVGNCACGKPIGIDTEQLGKMPPPTRCQECELDSPEMDQALSRLCGLCGSPEEAKRVKDMLKGKTPDPVASLNTEIGGNENTEKILRAAMKEMRKQ